MQTLKHFKTKLLDNGVLIVGFDCKDRPVNTLASDVLKELAVVVDTALTDDKVISMVLVSLKNDCFVAGADINELKSVTSKDECRELINKALALLEQIESSPKPFIAAIDGTCMGGGLELALACRWRIATSNPSTVLSLPEVKLGIIPGFGGTQRLPKLIGLVPALEMITSGKSVFPRKAIRTGLIDDLVINIPVEKRTIENITNETFVATAIKRATELSSEYRTPRKLNLRNRAKNWPLIRKAAAGKARKMVLAKTGGHYPAPQIAIDAVVNGGETEKILELITTPLAKNLMDIFLTTRALKPKAQNVVSPDRDQLCVLGAGLMGSQIAANLAEIGYTTVMRDISESQLVKGMDRAMKIRQKDLSQHIISQFEFDCSFLRVRPTTDIQYLKSASIVIEAVSEQLAVKRNIVKEFESTAPENTVFATNTSSYTVAEIAADAKHKERFVAMHFFNPLNAMKLVEIGVPDFASPEVVAKVIELARQMDKLPIVTKDMYGFLVNRILGRYLIESIILLTEGVPREQIDKTARKFGMAVDSGRAMGPLELIDFVGTETGLHVVKSLKRLGDRFEDRPEFATALKGQPGAETIDLPQNVIADRLILPMADEAIRCLAEAIVDSPEKVDMAMLYGAGFPAFTGGLSRWVKNQDPDRVKGRLEELAARYGPRFTPYENFKM